ncbi:MAG: hypothetical protein K1X56_06410 [Flavobacteriales bacterium]|nr:hypothetical protein [Flavobacteriales bacterium]
MKKWVNKNRLWLIGSLAGAVAGYVYWRTVGCSNGSCMITSTWYISTLYFSIGGALLFASFRSESKKTDSH